MSKLFTSDWHFHHNNIQKFTNRPWCAVSEIDKMIDHWNSQVRANDEIFHLGDFTFLSGSQRHVDMVAELLNQLNGRIYLIYGNHCHTKLWSRIELPHVVKLGHYKEIKENNQKIILSHYPMRSWNHQGRGSWQLHGHTHGSLPPIGKQLDVGIDNHPDFKIYNMDDIEAHMQNQPMYVEDHHKIIR